VGESKIGRERKEFTAEVPEVQREPRRRGNRKMRKGEEEANGNVPEY
jgi:hypothetical protein